MCVFCFEAFISALAFFLFLLFLVLGDGAQVDSPPSA